ncbi:MAG: SMEK domain-containing protein [Chloroflexi bacterium]|nr:SMEK domain-containing protein [Chloroflexota bacterium]
MLAKEAYLKKLSSYLALLQTHISMRGQMALFDVNIVAEDIVKELLNLAFGLELINLNKNTFNQASIDLGDLKNGVAVQVTSTKTSAKIETTINLFLEHGLYEKYSKLLIFVLQPKQKTYKKFDTHNLFNFDPEEHIIDFESFIRSVQSLETSQLKQLVDLLDTEIRIDGLKEDRSKDSPDALQEFFNQLTQWFKVLNYTIEPESVEIQKGYFRLIINVPERRGYSRIFVRGISGVAEMKDLHALNADIQNHRVNEAWLISARRVAQSVRNSVQDSVYCYTFDELIDLEADFTGYIDWLEREIVRRGIKDNYVDIACKRDETDPLTPKKVTPSTYDRSNGWIDGYIDQWLDDPAKEHISILGQFGMGKTWFALHYAWVMIRRYLDAKERGIKRPRLPLYIPLRDYAKAVSIESLFSEFFFRKHEIPIHGYSIFEELNRMGKFLLIFDGFDEMAAQIDRQKMINNFWQLARAVVPGTKVILTCRTEHFPEAKEGRSLLSAELRASISNLTGEPPQFEVLELLPFDDIQIKALLAKQVSPDVATRIVNDVRLLNLARRPVMTELIIEALPEITANKAVDIARIYLYAIQRKMERDIKAERTFTSMSDKLYFLCELSWEMLSTDRMQLNYREFPNRLTKLFPHAVKEQKNLDHWHYDMMGQTLLIRNSDGDYSPAHKSLPEFFVAYKFAAQLGGLLQDFLSPIFQQPEITSNRATQKYTWTSYFQREIVDAIKEKHPIFETFGCETLSTLATTFGKAPLSEALIEFLKDMVDKESLWNLVFLTRNKSFEETRFIGGNAITLLRRMNANLSDQDLSHTILVGADLFNADLSNTNLYGASLTQANLSGCTLAGTDLRFADLTDLQIGEMGEVLDVEWNPNGRWLASTSDNTNLYLWDSETWEQKILFKSNNGPVVNVQWSGDGRYLIALTETGNLNLWRVVNWQTIQLNGLFAISTFSRFAHDDHPNLAIGYSTGAVQIFHTGDWSVGHWWLPDFSSPVTALCFSEDNEYIAIGYLNGCVHVRREHNGELVQEIERLLSPITYLQFLEGNNYLLIYIGGYEIQGSVSGGRVLSAEANYLVEGYIEQAAEEFEVFYEDNKEQFEEKYKRRLKRNLSKQKLFKLKKDFYKETNPEGYRELLYWAEARAEEDLMEATWLDEEAEEEAYFDWPTRKAFVAGFVEKWDIRTGKRLLLRWSLTHEGMSMAYLDNGCYSVGRFNGSVLIWDNDFINIIKYLPDHTKPILAQSFNHSSKKLATGSADTTIRVWDVDKSSPSFGRCIKTLKIKMNCKGLQIEGARGLNVLSPDGGTSLKLWFVRRGALYS